MRVFSPRRDAQPKPVVFVAAAIVLTALLVAVVAQQLPPRGAVQDRLEPDFATLLPQGSKLISNTLEVPALPQPTYYVAHSAGVGTSLASIVWNRNNRRFEVTSEVDLDVIDGTVRSVILTTESMGRGAPTAVVARLSIGSAPDAMYVVMRDTYSLYPVSRTDASGTAGKAVFYDGSNAAREETFALGDVDGDGTKEAVQDSLRPDGSGVVRATVDVYRWVEPSGFVYDPALSATLTMSKSVFPEPAIVTGTQPAASDVPLDEPTSDMPELQ